MQNQISRPKADSMKEGGPAPTEASPANASDFFARDIDAILGLEATSRILRAAAAVSGLGFVAIARVTPDRWVTCASLDRLDFGLKPGDELPVNTTLCHVVRGCGEAIVIDDAQNDPVYRNHQTPKLYGFRSYISVPIIDSEGRFFGTLCGIGYEPASLRASATVETFALFADLVAAQLDAHREVIHHKRSLRSERNFGRLREEFMAALGHDLRNPVTAVLAGTRILERRKPDAETLAIVHQIRESAQRMDGLIGDLLDLARGRLGSGIPVERVPDTDLMHQFRSIVAEFETISECEFRTTFDCAPVNCDPVRMGQLFSNLIGNAVDHGTRGQPVEVRATTSEGQFRLSVTNAGRPIDDQAQRWIFLPFRRGQSDVHREGLGLGLYIASQIAKAHGGTLTHSNGDGTVTFTLTMPC